MRKKKFGITKKLLSTCLIVTMGLSTMLAGCGKSSSAQAQGTEDGKDGAVPTLTIWSYWTDGDIFKDQGDMEYWKAVEKACNVKLKFVDSSNGKDALSLLVGTDDMPDIVIDYDGTFPGGIQKMANDGSIVPLNELMDKGYMPNFKSYLKSDPEADKLCKDNKGEYPWAPMIRKPDSPLVFSGFAIRQDWLDELNLQTPTTLDDMEKVLLAFKEKKNADAPFSFIYQNYSAIVNSFGMNEGLYIGEDNKVHFGPMEDKYLDFLTMFNRWYKEGIIDPDGFTQEPDAFFAKVASNRTGIVWGYTGGTLGKIETMKQENPDINFQPMAYPVLKEGEKFPFDESNYRVNAIGGAISASCKNLKAAAKVLDYNYSEEGNMRANYGEEGKTYTMVDGKPQFTDFVLKNPDGYSIEKALSIYAGCNNKPFLVEKDYMLGGYVLDTQKKSLDIWNTPDAVDKNLPPQSMTPEELEEYNSIMTTINTYVDEYKLKFILGSESLDNFPEFVKNLKGMGIDRAIEIRQAEYDRYLKR